MLTYKQNVLDKLRAAGYSRTYLRKNKIFGERTMSQFGAGDTSISCRVIDRLCSLLHCQPGDLLEYVPDVPEVPEENNA